MKRTAHTRWSFPAFAALLLPACGDDGTDPRALDYRPWETVSQMEDVVGPLLDGENTLLGINAAGTALIQFSAEPAAAMLRVGPSLDVRSGAAALRPHRADWSTRITIPAEIAHRTLVWDVDGQAYVVDETRTDAPEGGVRVVYYAMNSFTNRPAEPLVPLGHIDLIDEDIEGEERLRIRIVDASGPAPVDLVDYVVGFTGSGEASAGNFVFTAVGALSDGTQTVDFDLAQTFTWSEAEDTETLGLDYQYATGARSVRVRMDASSAFEEADRAEISLLVDVADGVDDVAVAVAIAPNGRLDGEIRLNGTAVIEVAGSDGSPTFTYAGGGALSAEQVESLRELWALVTGVLDLTNALMAPRTLLLLPG
jgi:hypothetical protein